MTGSSLRQEALAMFKAGVAAADPRAAVRRHLRRRGARLHLGDEVLDLGEFRRVVVVGAGKAAASMAWGVEEVLGPVEGLVVVKEGHGMRLGGIRVMEATHPDPGRAGLRAATALAALADTCTGDDLALALVSGGGSALLPLPLEGLDLEDLQAVNRALLASGAPIGEVNTVRRHLTALQGGRLAQRLAPATLRTLVLSDVPGDAVHDVASGPTAPDPTSAADALAVLARRRVDLPRVRRFLESAPETPASLPGPPPLVVASNSTAVGAAADLARNLGYAVEISRIAGEALRVGEAHAAWARAHRGRRSARIAGGESTVTWVKRGKGGRNQEVALSAALGLEGTTDAVVLAAGTDGTDGPTDAAGAWADGSTAPRARAAGLDPERHLRDHDAYPLFARLGDLLLTGPTRTNVMDLHLVLTA